MLNIHQTIANELSVKEQQVQAAVTLIDEGATVPFIARYRKEATGGLDDNHLRQLEQRLGYLRELEERRQVILKSIDEQGKLTDSLRKAVLEADSKTRLEDLYLPYRPKRRTKGQIAIEAGLEPLANLLLTDRDQQPESAAEIYVNSDKGIADTKAALDGARYILMERFAEDAGLLQKIRTYLWHNAEMVSRVVAAKKQEGAKFSDYFEHHELLRKIPSHRALAMLRGRNEGILQLSLDADPGEEQVKYSHCEQIISEHLGLQLGERAADKWLRKTLQWTWKIKLLLHMETELMAKVREQSEYEAIKVFARNLKDLLMAAPAGPRTTMGLDPGLRTGVKVAIVDNTGKLVATSTIYPHAPQKQWDKSARTLGALCRQHKVELIAIGNGTASRETDNLANEVLKAESDLNMNKIMVSEAGASVYSASECAAQEFPDLDVSLRGAVSIARRLQDPLAELVKIEPKAIGVGQYQHDVSQSQLAKSLDAVVEDCVNAVGVDVNTASAPLLARVSGLSRTLAQNVVLYRDENGRFEDRKQLKKVSRLGPKAFEQCAGFMRIMNGKNPLDASSVHPEAYPVIEKICASDNLQVSALIGNSQYLTKLNPANFTDDSFGIPTVTDIISELDKPGRDPRPEFRTAKFKEGVEKLVDLNPGMILEGVVTNVTNFGAFVDIGVHQDGLVHISALANKFVSDPSEVVKAGDIVKVKVIEVDLKRQRINLSMRLSEQTSKASPPVNNRKRERKPTQHRSSKPRQPENKAMGNAFADAFAKLKK